ncbi:hypothetical protein D3C73_1320220 [compost metagenome]
MFKVVTGDAVEDLANLLAVLAGERQAQNAGVFAGFRHAEVVLQGVYHAQRGIFADSKGAASSSMNSVDLHRDAAVV